MDIIRKDHSLGLDSLYRVNIRDTEKNDIRVVAPFIAHGLTPKKRKWEHLAGPLDDTNLMRTSSLAPETNTHYDLSMSNPRNEHTEDPYATGNISKDAVARASDPNFGAETF